MGALAAFWPAIQPYVGTVPMWAMLAIIVVAYLQMRPKMKAVEIKERESIRDPYLTRINELREDVEKCRQECNLQERELREEIDSNKKACDEREEALKKEIDDLKTKINNEAWQRTQSEISLVTTLVQVLPDPLLKKVLEALNRRSVSQPGAITALGGPVTDAKGE